MVSGWLIKEWVVKYVTEVSMVWDAAKAKASAKAHGSGNAYVVFISKAGCPRVEKFDGSFPHHQAGWIALPPVKDHTDELPKE
jgi:hypothetical protein